MRAFDNPGLLLLFVPPLIVVGLVAAVVYAIVRANRRGVATTRPGIGTVRHFYFYLVALIALIMAAAGVALVGGYILRGLLESGPLSRSSASLAAGMAMALVGGPLWAFHWLAVQRQVRKMPFAGPPLLGKLYVYLVLGVSVGTLATAAVPVLQWLFRTDTFPSNSFAAFTVGCGIWLYHWRLESREGPLTEGALAVRRLYLYLVAVFTLAWAATGSAIVLHALLREGYDAASSAPVLLSSGDRLGGPTLRDALAHALVAGAVWGLHWLRFARDDRGSTLRRVYLHIFGTFGGAMAVVASLGILGHGLLVWLLGAHGETTAAGHFRFLPGAVSSMLVGLAVWLYHRGMARREGMPEPDEVHRVYRYLLVAVGVGITATGVSMLVYTLIGLATESAGTVLADSGVWRKQVATVVTLALLGVPLWAYNWASLQADVSAWGAEERVSPVRRVFTFAVLGIGVIALLVSLSAVAFFFLRDVFDASLSQETLRDARIPLGAIAAAALFIPYYWMVYRADTRAAPDEEAAPRRAVRKTVTVLIGPGGELFVRLLEAALGYSVTTLQRADPGASLPDPSTTDYAGLARDVAACEGANVLLVAETRDTRVLSYD